MYHVVITEAYSDIAIDQSEFPIGQWQEIGYWLDDHGYIDVDYIINVYVVEMAAA